jgi:MbtH protein
MIGLDQYLVVVNDEGQYSIWPARKELPAGWAQVGEPGPRDERLAYIERVWTDMTPRSLRQGATAAPPSG